MKMKEKKHYHQSRLIVKNVEMMKQFGGCYKQEVQMNQLHNFIDAQNAAILGEITHNV